MVPRYLYRGDKEGNLTMPQKYWSGLYTKLLQSGNPAYITKNGIIQAIKSHISPTNFEEKIFYHKSHFLSFSETIEIAKYYAFDKQTEETFLERWPQENRYIFTFDLSKTNVESLSADVFRISFSCDANCCEICQERNDLHYLLVLDVVSLLKENSTYLTNPQALINAEQDKEWLVLPYDYKPELYGYSGRIPPARFWTTEVLERHSETEHL